MNRARGDPSLRPCQLCGERSALARLRRVRGYTIVRCRRCGLVYTNEIPSREQLHRIYSADFFDVGAKYEASRPDAPDRLNAPRSIFATS